MVGSVLMERMRAENDFKDLAPVFFSTSQAGQPGPEIGRDLPPVADAYDEKRLGAQEVILSCQGGGYTTKIYPRLRAEGWQGYWIDAASSLRMEDNAVIILDPGGGHAALVVDFRIQREVLLDFQGVLARGDLKFEYSVPWEDIRWRVIAGKDRV